MIKHAFKSFSAFEIYDILQNKTVVFVPLPEKKSEATF